MQLRNLTGRLLLTVAALGTQLGLAESIGINFVGLKPDSQTLAPDDEAGAKDVAQTHWNNMTIENSDPNGHNNRGTLDKVVNSDGDTVKSMPVTVEATRETKVYATNAVSWGFKGTDLTLQSGQIHPQPRITVTNIPYDHYGVYVYLGAGNNKGLGKVSIRKPENAKGAVSRPATYYYLLNWQKGQFKQSRAESLEEAKKAGGGNCVYFGGNSADSFIIETDGLLGQGWTGVTGLQIVEIHAP